MSLEQLLANEFSIDPSAIEQVVLNKENLSLHIKIKTNSEISDDDIDCLRSRMISIYSLNDVTVEQTYAGDRYEEFRQKREKEFKHKIKHAKESPLIFGSPIKGKKTNLSDINDLTPKTVVEGEVFWVERKDIRGGRSLLSFQIYDDSGAIGCKLVLANEQADKLEPHIKKGARLLMKGESQYDKYAREILFVPSDVEKVPPIPIKMDNAESKRVELHLHTQMSSMDGLTPVKKLVSRAQAWGHPAMAITDHGVVQAFPDAYDAAGNDFKLIFGVECYLIDDADDIKAPYYHAVILAKNQAGLKNLYAIISESHLKYFYKRPRVPKSLFDKYRDGLILGSACEAGEVYRAILNNKADEDINQIAEYYDYLEIMPTGHNRFLIDNGTLKTVKDLKKINTKIAEVGERLGKLVVATGDVHFMDEKDSVFRAIVQAGQGYKDADNQAPLYFMTTQEMLDEFSYFGEEKAYKYVVTNSNAIADMIEQLKPIPDGTYPPEMEGADKEIQDMCECKAKELYGDELPDLVRARMDKELEKIIKYGFSVMYLIAQRLVSKSMSDGYVVGSRGSVGSSFVAFLCGITDVNALPPHYFCPNCKKSEFITDGSVGCGVDMEDEICPNCEAKYKKDGHDIPFETFLGFEGDKEPDIDLNFSGDYQQTAHKYVEELFGSDNVFKAGTISTLADKTAYGFVKKYLEERNKVVHSAEINRIIQNCVGVKRTTGQHPGGLMILPKGRDIHEFCPVQYPADDKNKNVITTHFDYNSISGRLLKLDILGHDNPTIIRMLEDLTGIKPQDVPLDDEKTMSLFSSTEALGVTPEEIGSEVGTFGIPEFGTRFVRNMLVETLPETLSELVRISGLSHGTDVWSNNAQILVKNGTVTLKEAICTRDDIMVYLMYQGLPSKAAFDIMERVRKGRKLTPEYEKMMREYKVPEWYIESCNKILYMFPKAHAVAYVTMAVIIAYFKVYYPKEFYISYFSVRADEFDISIMHDEDKVQAEIKRMEAIENDLNAKDKNVLTILQIVREMFVRGINFDNVDLYKSHYKKFLPTETGILPPLMSIAGLGESVAVSIAEEREKREFHSIEDLRQRTKLNKTVVESMQNMGILEGMTESSQISFIDL